MDPEQLPLRDLHLPAEIGVWPLAPGWWVLIALAAAGLAWLLTHAWRRYRRNAARRAALRELGRLTRDYRESGNVVELGRRLSTLLRRAMLAYAPRPEVAGLTGDRWLAWLDRGLEARPFSAGPGRDIERLPYRNPQLGGDDVDVEGLLDAVRARLVTPLPEGSR